MGICHHGGLIGLSRVMLGYHWLSDVKGGWIIGVDYLAFVSVIWQVMSARCGQARAVDRRYGLELLMPGKYTRRIPAAAGP